jgi:hypothetical protein
MTIGQAANGEQCRTQPGPGLLGGYVVPSGYGMRLEPIYHQGYCRFNVGEVVFDNGDVQNVWDANLCEATQVVTYGHRRNGFFHNVVY